MNDKDFEEFEDYAVMWCRIGFIVIILLFLIFLTIGFCLYDIEL